MLISLVNSYIAEPLLGNRDRFQTSNDRMEMSLCLFDHARLLEVFDFWLTEYLGLEVQLRKESVRTPNCQFQTSWIWKLRSRDVRSREASEPAEPCLLTGQVKVNSENLEWIFVLVWWCSWMTTPKMPEFVCILLTSRGTGDVRQKRATPRLRDSDPSSKFILIGINWIVSSHWFRKSNINNVTAPETFQIAQDRQNLLYCVQWQRSESNKCEPWILICSTNSWRNNPMIAAGRNNALSVIAFANRRCSIVKYATADLNQIVKWIS